MIIIAIIAGAILLPLGLVIWVAIGAKRAMNRNDNK